MAPWDRTSCGTDGSGPAFLADLLDGASVCGKGYRLGTHRTVAPAETVERVRPHLKAMGITRVADVTGLDRIGIPVTMVYRPNSRSVAVSQGKGLDLDSAVASGLMESIETFHAERITLPLKLASFRDLSADHRIADLSALPSVPDSRFHPDLALLWIEAWDLFGDGPVWLPYETVHANYTVPPPQGSGCFSASTNGLASGNHPLEAILHGVCEVVERDATALWRGKPRADLAATRLDLASVGRITVAGLLERLAAAGLEVAAWDTTSDLDIPAFYALLLDPADPRAHVGIGAGCHPSKEVALLRALSEAVQVRTTYITGARDDLSPEEYAHSAIAERVRACRALVEAGPPARRFEDVPDREGDSIAGDLRWVLGRLEAVGIRQVAVVDLTRADMGIPVLRVVIPGLEGPDDDDDYVPGRRALEAEAGRP